MLISCDHILCTQFLESPLRLAGNILGSSYVDGWFLQQNNTMLQFPNYAPYSQGKLFF